MMDLERTKRIALQLQSLLKCGICNDVLQKPCTLGGCEHFFCSECIQQYLGCPCPTCGVPSHKKNMQVSRQLIAATSACQEILSLLSEVSLSESSPTLTETESEEELALCDVTHRENEHLRSENSDLDETEDSNEQTRKQGRLIDAEGWQDEVREPQTSEKQGSLRSHVHKPDTENQFPIFLPGRSKRARFRGMKNKVVSDKKVTRQPKLKSSMRRASLTSAAGAATDEKNVTTPEIYQSSGGHCLESIRDFLTISEQNKEETLKTAEMDISTFGAVSNADASPKYTAIETSVETPLPTHRRNRSSKNSLDSSVSKPNSVPLVTPTSCNTSAKRNVTGRAKRNCIKSPTGVKLVGLSPQMLKRNAKGETALHLAAIKCEEVNVKAILETGFNPDTKDNAGWTPLHEACNRGYVGIATLLLDYGATINMPGGDNETALHDAVYNGRVECAQLLVSRGAAVDARDRHGKTPLDIAYTDIMKEALMTPVAEMFSNKQVEVVMSKSAVQTPCHLASHDLTSEKVVLMLSGLERTDKQNIKLWVRELGWTIRDTYSSQVTHLVVSTNPAGSCRRTIKFLQAVVSGLWVVDFAWAVECQNSKLKVAEDNFEVKGTTGSPGTLAPKRARMNHEKQLPGLFDGCHFYFTGEFGPPPIPSRDELIQLVRLGGGLVHSREPKLEAFNALEITVPYHADPRSSLVNCSFFIVNSSVKEMFFRNKERTMCRVPHSWILACIAEFRILEELPEL